ncbi:putative phosphoglycerate mutase pmu1 [Thecaphora frezii]
MSSPPSSSTPLPATKWSFSTLPSYFIYDTAPSATSLPAVDANFGLLPNLTWSSLTATLANLNAQSNNGDGSVYKLVFAGRHGQGWHNVAESLYGTPAWDSHWSLLNGDGNMTWGPDARLTPLGEQQANDVRTVWLDQLNKGGDKAPLPQSLYSSPMTRSTKTLEISYGAILFDVEGQKQIKGLKHVKPLIKEALREQYGEHTCDKRSTKKQIHKLVPEFRIEKGFAQEDLLWTATERETNDHVDARVTQALEDMWNSDDNDVIGITSHSGVMQGLFRVTGHSAIKLATGAFVPLVIKGTPVNA